MANHKTRIGQYDIDATTGYAEDSGTNGCWINKGRFSASLAALEDMGWLEDHNTGETHKVASSIIEAITAWAKSKGY